MNELSLINIAQAQMGVSELPANSNKTTYGEWFGLNGVAWCGIFVSWCYHKAGFPLGNIGFKKGFAGCQTAVAHFKSTGEVTEFPYPGDIVFFDWNGDGRYDHTGIYLSEIDDDTFQTIEGNTSMKNNSNGGTVMKRYRSYQNVLFVHPKVLNKPRNEKLLIDPLAVLK